MKLLFSTPFFLLLITVCIVSGYSSWHIAHAYGGNDVLFEWPDLFTITGGAIYGAMAVALEFVKPFAGLIFVVCLCKGLPVGTMLFGVLSFFVFFVSFYSGVTYQFSQVEMAQLTRADQTLAYDHLKKQIDQPQAWQTAAKAGGKEVWTSRPRDKAVLDALITQALSKKVRYKRWDTTVQRLTKGCSPTNRHTANHCTHVATLRLERAKSIAHGAKQQRAAKAITQLAGKRTLNEQQMFKGFTQLFGVSIDNQKQGRIIIFQLLVELLSGFGLAMWRIGLDHVVRPPKVKALPPNSLAKHKPVLPNEIIDLQSHRGKKPTPATHKVTKSMGKSLGESVSLFVRQCQNKCQFDDWTSFQNMFGAYCNFCQANGFKPCAGNQFGAFLRRWGGLKGQHYEPNKQGKQVLRVRYRVPSLVQEAA